MPRPPESSTPATRVLHLSDRRDGVIGVDALGISTPVGLLGWGIGRGSPRGPSGGDPCTGRRRASAWNPLRPPSPALWFLVSRLRFCALSAWALPRALRSLRHS